MPTKLAIGDYVTVNPTPTDPVEITVHQHAVITKVTDWPSGAEYEVGHPPATRRYGPYTEARLKRGWK